MKIINNQSHSTFLFLNYLLINKNKEKNRLKNYRPLTVIINRKKKKKKKKIEENNSSY